MIDKESLAAMERMRQDPDVRTVEPLCPDRFALRYDDGSALLVNKNGDIIKSPLSKYEVVSNLQYLGELEGKPHFAFEGCDYATRHWPDTVMFDSEGHQKMFRDPKTAGIEGVEYVKWEFERLEKLANDPSNPRRNDPVLVDLDEPKQSLGMRR